MALKSLPSVQAHFKWLEKKRILKQDVLLLSPPSTFSRRVLTEFAATNKIPFEYLSLSIDTSESDLKTRKELSRQQVLFADQAPVRAALQGKMLILDGLEKCERNVLPTLNNLLENREINLDDGRHLVSHARYQHLLQRNSRIELERMGILSCHPDFFVAALTCPVPKFPGRPLDPPLRSRFQVRLVEFPSSSAEEVLDAYGGNGMIDRHALEFILALNAAADTQPELRLRRIPEMNIFSLSRTISKSSSSLGSVYSRYYPWLQHSPNVLKLFPELAVKEEEKLASATSASLPPSRQRVLEAMVEDHVVGKRDVLVCGAAGSGKSFIANEFVKRVTMTSTQRAPILFPLYRDMSSRDLMARRRIENGDSVWEHSPLVRGAVEGRVVVLDGLEKLDSSVVGVLSRVCEDRELHFLNGERLEVHPDFRIVALATTTSTASASKQSSARMLFTPEVLGMFNVHQLAPFSVEEISQLAAATTSSSSFAAGTKRLFDFAAELDAAGDLLPASTRLSLRSCLRILQRAQMQQHSEKDDDSTVYYSASLIEQIKRSLLEPFLTPSQRDLIGKLLVKSGFPANAATATATNHHDDNSTDISISSSSSNTLNIGQVSFPRFPVGSRPELVPQVTFYDVPHHRATLQAMLVDFSIGARNLLLIGNQGVGKNKVADRLLELLNLEREYIQLHRDSSVQSLTGTPTLQNGQLVFEDSPLVRAAKTGRCILVDEADKAPPEVVSVLKSLVEENGEILLGNGQRLVRRSTAGASGHDEIPIHKDFCVWILSNRGGFPFQGNSFMDQIGDVFSTHVVSNPDFASELSMLESYAPGTDKALLAQLCRCFADLRQLSDEGLLTYPYSTREAVHVARHLERFPEDGLVAALHNVLDFDAYNAPESLQLVLGVLQRHNIPFAFDDAAAGGGGGGGNSRSRLGTNLGKTEKLPPLRPSGEVWWKKNK